MRKKIGALLMLIPLVGCMSNDRVNRPQLTLCISEEKWNDVIRMMREFSQRRALSLAGGTEYVATAGASVNMLNATITGLAGKSSIDIWITSRPLEKGIVDVGLEVKSRKDDIGRQTLDEFSRKIQMFSSIKSSVMVNSPKICGLTRKSGNAGGSIPEFRGQEF